MTEHSTQSLQIRCPQRFQNCHLETTQCKIKNMVSCWPTKNDMVPTNCAGILDRAPLAQFYSRHKGPRQPRSKIRSLTFNWLDLHPEVRAWCGRRFNRRFNDLNNHEKFETCCMLLWITDAQDLLPIAAVLLRDCFHWLGKQRHSLLRMTPGIIWARGRHAACMPQWPGCCFTDRAHVKPFPRRKQYEHNESTQGLLSPEPCGSAHRHLLQHAPLEHIPEQKTGARKMRRARGLQLAAPPPNEHSEQAGIDSNKHLVN